MTQERIPPYWLADGTEACALCASLYLLEMEYRCAGCDRGLCEQCALLVREVREVVCRECHGAGVREG